MAAREEPSTSCNPMPPRWGGFSESRRIGWMAQAFGIRLIPHGWSTAVGLAADLHLASALPETDLVEYITGSPIWMTWSKAVGTWTMRACSRSPKAQAWASLWTLTP